MNLARNSSIAPLQAANWSGQLLRQLGITLNFPNEKSTKVWSQTESNVSNPVSNQTTVMHLDLAVITNPES